MGAIYESYWDDSEHDTSKHFGVGGFAGKEDAWRSLEPKWLAALPEGIDYFHATDCFSGNKQFEPQKGFPPIRRSELLDKLTDLICDADIKLISRAIDVPKYVRFAPKRIENDFLGNKYVACLDANIQNVCRDYMSPSDSPLPIDTGDVCAVFYEEGDYADSVSRHVRMMREDKELWWRERIGNATPGTKTGPAAIPLLQVADLGVFLGVKFAVNAPDGKIPWRPYFEKLRLAGRVWGAVKLTESSIGFLHAIFSIREDPRILEEAWSDDTENRVREVSGFDEAHLVSSKSADRQEARGMEAKKRQNTQEKS